MEATGLPTPIFFPPLLPNAHHPLIKPVEATLERWMMPPDLVASVHLASVHTAAGSGSGPAFARRLLESLDIRFAVEPRDIERIPAKGPAVVVANHPYGFAEGLILTILLGMVRPDFRIGANSLLSAVDAMRGHLIAMNPFETQGAVAENCRALRECLAWLGRGGLLAMFPAGEVAHLSWTEHAVTDPPWKPTAARLAMRARCPVIPVYFEGANSLSFQLAGVLHPGLRTINLPRECWKMRRKTVRVRIGAPISPGVLSGCGSPERASDYLRSRTFFLGHRPQSLRAFLKPAEISEASDGALGAGSVASEVAALPPDRRLLENRDFSVYLASAAEIPLTLQEIGRSREIAFRQVGEGCGKESDLDGFDGHYQHLFLWHKADARLAGAYRLAITTDVLPRFGTKGLYTSKLFRYKPEFFKRLGPAMELGRSFICPRYQKSYAPLLLLWKGIARVLDLRPEAAALFGAVSISRDYCAASRGLIANYLKQRASHDLARLVRPRVPYRDRTARNAWVKRLAELTAGIEDLSASISDIEGNGKGVPVLVRQYLKAGGQLLGFNIDPSFSGVLDALLLVELNNQSAALVERCRN